MIRSVFPHGWSNLRSAYYNEYKYNILSQEESIFAYRSDYLKAIATLNVKNIRTLTEGLSPLMKSKEMKALIEKTPLENIPIDALHDLIIKNKRANNPLLKQDLHTLGQTLYERILYPTKETANTK